MNNKYNKQGKKINLDSKNKKGKIVEMENNKINSNKMQNNNLHNYENLNYISNIKNIPQIDIKYRNELDNRMDLIMKKIEQNIK